MSVRGVILAAGFGSRMGRVKQLLPFRGRPLVQHVIDAAKASRLAHVMLVLGHAGPEILSRIDARGIDAVMNPDFAAGQSASLRCGLTHGPDADGVMFLLGDQPLVDSAFIDAIVARFLAERPWAVVPVHGDRPGNPVVIGRELLGEASELRGDTGARGLLRKYERHVLRLGVDDPLALRDVDTMDDYLALLAAASPTEREISRP